jgi:hypothetical protein
MSQEKLETKAVFKVCKDFENICNSRKKGYLEKHSALITSGNSISANFLM